MQKLFSFLVFLMLVSLLQVDAQSKKKSENSNYGATIEKNLEAYTLLDRAKVFIESKKYQDAVLLLKVICEKYPNALFSSEEVFYLPFREKITDIISGLPMDAKNLFLIEINSIASGLYKKALEEASESLFEEIFQKYYLSELGDDAANQLGVIFFDKGSFIKSIYYFEKAIEHPLCSLNKDKINLNLYYLYQITKNEKKSHLIYQQLKSKLTLKDILNKIENAVVEFGKHSNNGNLEKNELISFQKLFWTTVWQEEFDLVFKNNSNGEYVGGQRKIRRIRNRNTISYEAESIYDEELIINEWKQNNWYPVNISVVADNRVIFRKNDQIKCFALDNQKKMLWEANVEGPVKNSNYANNYYEPNYNGSESRIPTSREEVLAFSDQLGKQMTVRNGVLYVIANHEKTGAIVPYFQRRFGGNFGNQKFEGNMIFAIDIKSGKKLWKKGGSSDKNDPFYNAVFLHLPVETPYGLYVTYQLNSDIYGATFSKQSDVLWNKYLCSAESNFDMITNNAACVYGDDNIFITIDFGVIIKLNASTGNYNWVKRYLASSEQLSEYYVIPSVKNGIEINSLIYQMGRLVILPSDINMIYVFDSENGKEIYKISDYFGEFRRYLIGYDESGYYLAGSRGIRKYDYFSNQIKWQADIKENYGKGIIAGQHILYPSNRKLYVIDKESGKKISIININLENQNEPLGNISTGGSYLVSTNYNSVSIINEVDLIINNLSESISKNKTDELLHQRGVLYCDIGEYKKSFDDIAEAITLVNASSNKNLIYCEAMLDLFEKIHGVGEDKKYQSSILEMFKYFTDSTHKSLLYFLEGEIHFENKKYTDSAKSFMLSLSQPSSGAKHRSFKNEKGSASPTYLSLLKIEMLLNQKLISEEFVFGFLENSDLMPEEFISLCFLEKLPTQNLKKSIFKSFLKKCNNDFSSIKLKSFFYCLMNSEDPRISLTAKYYLMLQQIQLKEYYSAGLALESFRKLKSDETIYTEYGLELLSNKLGQYKPNVSEVLTGIQDPAIKLITDPPLKEIWNSKKIGEQTSMVKFAGSSIRPEFMERNIYIFNRNENKVYACDLLSGEKKWNYEVAVNKNFTRINENERTLDFNLRMEGIGLLSVDQNDFAVDLKTGRNLWSLPQEKTETLDMGSGCLVKYRNKELIIFDAFTGKRMYSLFLKEDIKKAVIYKGRLVVLNIGSTIINLFNLYTGEKIIELTFNNSLRDNFFIFIGDNLIIQNHNSQIIAYSIKNGALTWQCNIQGAYLKDQNNIFNINNTNLIMYSQNGMIYNISCKDGKVLWQYEILERYLYRTIDLCPVSGNDTLLLLCSSQIKQISNNSTGNDTYFIIDMSNGKVIHKVVAELAQQDLWRPRFAINFAFKGDVIPKITSNNGNGIRINFIRKRDSQIVKKHFIDLKSYGEYDSVSVKGCMFFFYSHNDVYFYGNPDAIETQRQKLKLLAEAFNEK